MLRGYDLLMEETSWKEKVREAFSNLPKSVQTADVAKVTGIKPGRLYSFLSRGVLNSDDLRALDLWLREKGYIDSDALPPSSSSPEPDTPDIILAKDLRLLADIMESSSYDKDFKARKYAAFIKFNADNLPEILKSVEGGGEAG